MNEHMLRRLQSAKIVETLSNFYKKYYHVSTSFIGISDCDDLYCRYNGARKGFQFHLK